MSDLLVFWNRSGASEIEIHLRECSARFAVPLENRVKIDEYAEKLSRLSHRCEVWDGPRLIGLLAVYLNDPESGVGFVSSVSVCEECAGQGVGRLLIEEGKKFAAQRGFSKLQLEVHASDHRTVGFYQRCGFVSAGLTVAGFEVMIATTGVA